MHLLPPNFGSYLLILLLDGLTFGLPLFGYYLCRDAQRLGSRYQKLLASLVLLSMACCGLSIWLEMVYLGRLKEMVDIQAWYDDVDSQASSSLIFLGLTIFVNILVIGSSKH